MGEIMGGNLHRLIIPWQESEFPFPWEKKFRDYRGFHLEIGFGNGEFLVYLAKVFPEALIIGIELSSRSLLNAMKRIRKEKISNIALLQGEGKFLLKNLFPSFFLTGIYINFPDPWPKGRHAKRRLITPEFLRILSQKLRRNGKLLITTDWMDYAEQIEKILKDFGEFQRIHPPSWLLSFSTKYMRKAKEEGREINFFFLEKLKDLRYFPEEFKIVEPMPHVVFKAEIGMEDLFSSFTPQEKKFDHIVIKFQEVYLSQNKDSLLFPVIVIEEGMKQEFAIMLVPHGQDWILKLSSIGRPLITWGVKKAIKEIFEWLKSRIPLEVKNSTLP